MRELEKAKELINKNRLLVATSVAWVIISNLLYFSQVDKSSCLDIRTFEGSSTPDWMILWYKLTLGYVSLYETIHEPYQSSRFICSQTGFSDVGYFSFVSLPILTITLFVITVKWVRRA
ncbi:MAG: hypothetical protein HRU77_07660 [Gammaproteobacteria bacterium]|nr:MAG: hypothetical protein HRU77_07660 [Gammaproteobacteria bacterium]